MDCIGYIAELKRRGEVEVPLEDYVRCREELERYISLERSVHYTIRGVVVCRR